VITGGTSGMGLATAKPLLDQGALVLVGSGSRGRSVLTRSNSGLPVLAKHREHQHGPPDQRAAHVWKSTRRRSDAPSGSSPK
jgi:NAD(P)-dependent dehydrogenase (short-subunit alcohol dehydrogenase family)